jgi:hypothetical protein
MFSLPFDVSLIGKSVWNNPEGRWCTFMRATTKTSTIVAASKTTVTFCGKWDGPQNGAALGESMSLEALFDTSRLGG